MWRSSGGPAAVDAFGNFYFCLNLLIVVELPQHSMVVSVETHQNELCNKIQISLATEKKTDNKVYPI